MRNFLIILMSGFVTLNLSGCSDSKTPLELITAYEQQRQDEKFEALVLKAEAESQTQNPTVDLITFQTLPIPPYFYDHHVRNGLDVSNTTIGTPPAKELPVVNTKIELPEGATRTEIGIDIPEGSLVLQHDHSHEHDGEHEGEHDYDH